MNAREVRPETGRMATRLNIVLFSCLSVGEEGFHFRVGSSCVEIPLTKSGLQ